jgi:hypothetical protein
VAEPGGKIGVSIRARLLNLAKRNNEQFELMLTRFVLERFLHRLSLTRYRESFVLKGAMLVTKWIADPHRQTRDIDFLKFGDPAPETLLGAFGETCAVRLDDAGLRIDKIRETVAYGGLRITTTATLGGARVKVVIDVGFGDATEPGVEEIIYPVLLDLPAPRLRAYARETVIAEKFQAMVMFGRANSRLKDYHDLWILSRTYEFVGDRLPRAIAATFARRGTAIPAAPPEGVSDAFAATPERLRQWEEFVDEIGEEPVALIKVVHDLVAFLMPHAAAARMVPLPG